MKRKLCVSLGMEGFTDIHPQVLVDRAFLRRIPWQRNDTVVVRSPRDRRRLSTGRLRHFEGEYARIRDKAGFATFVPVPRGHCWVEFEGASTNAGGSKLYETIPLALVEGRVACVLWPASRVRWLDRK